MRIAFHGAARTVTGSRHLLEVGGSRILLDCGVYQGPDAEMELRNRAFPFDVTQVDALVLSHAHNDHCGNIPNLVRHGFRGEVLATPPTVDLAKHIMLDSAKIQESDARYDNKHRAHGAPEAQPLFTSTDAERAWRHFAARPGGEPFEVAPGIRVQFAPAGHILGAAVVLLELEEHGRRVRLGFSGDLGRYNVPLLRDPTPLADLDYLILESTYGDRVHMSVEDAYNELRDVVSRCCMGPGKLLIPSFALGRAQDLIFHFHRMMDRGEIDPVPIYVDSPLAVRLTEVFRKHRDAFDEEAHAFMGSDAAHGGPLDFPQVRYISEVADSVALNDTPGPMIIISSSGMLTGGRIRHHLRHTVTDPRNTILLVSWQAPGTLGRRLVEGADTIRLFGQELPVRATVKVINGFSAHADRNGLADFAVAARPRRGTFLVHGEPGPAFDLAELLHERGVDEVAVPQMDESFEL